MSPRFAAVLVLVLSSFGPSFAQDSHAGHARQAGARLAVAYETTPQGAAVRYRSDDPEVVEALHLWFAVQKSDHGAHAGH